MLRIWVPGKLRPQDLPGELFKELENLDCIRTEPFYVEENVCHWKWVNKETNENISPSPTDVNNLTVEMIKAVNEGNESVKEELEGQHLLREYDPKEGIKFFMLVPPPGIGELPSTEFKNKVISRLKEMMNVLPRIKEPSIYTGSGFTWILIKGKVEFSGPDYHTLSELVGKIIEEGAKGFYIRTYTSLVTNIDYCIEKEELLPEEKIEYDITYYLEKEEDEKFEIKGSLWFNVERWLRERKGDFRDEEIAQKGVLRSIVAFLNTEGGQILIGVLEEKRFSNVLKDPDCPLHKLPKYKGRIILGIENEYYAGKGWDGFILKLSDLISTHIAREVSSIIRIQKYEYEGHDLCLIHVPKGLRWYYLDKKEFWVRRSNSTISLEGMEMDDYKTQRELGRKYNSTTPIFSCNIHYK